MLSRRPDNCAVALALAEQGFFVFPCQEEGEDAKKPKRGVFWRSTATRDPAKIRRWWTQHPDALPGIECSKSGLVVVDADRHGGPDGVSAWDDLASKYEPIPAPTVTTPSGGRHIYFKQPRGGKFGNRKGDLPPAVDVRGAGGYVIGGGATFPDGRAYLPQGDFSSIPELPDWLAEILRGESPSVAPQPATPVVIQQTSDARLRAYAERGVDAELAKVRESAPGTWNNTLNDAAFALGQMAGAGWIGQGEAEAWLLDAALAARPKKRAEAASTIRSGMKGGMAKPRVMPDSFDDGDAEAGAEIVRRLTRTKCGDLIDEETGEIIADAKPAIGEFPDALTRPPGLVGEIVDWIEATARRSSRVLALPAALTVVGTAIGRDRSGPTDSATHLYCIGLAPTGAGKDHPLQQVKRLLSASGMSSLIGPSEFRSGTAATRFLQRSPLSLCVMDEVGAMLQTISDRRAGPFVKDLTKFFRTVWSASFTPFATAEWAERSSEVIEAPAMSIFGVSTAEEFLGALTGADVINGFLNRFAVFAVDRKPQAVKPATDPLRVPPAISERLTYLFNGGNPLGVVGKTYGQDRPIIRKVPFGAKAEAVFDDLLREVDVLGETNPELAPIYSRTAEMAIRAATIVACGESAAAPVISARTMLWARDTFMHVAKTVATSVVDQIAETENQRQAKAVFAVIRDAGSIQRRDLLRRLNHRFKARDLEEVLKALSEAEQIRIVQEFKSGPGRKATSYEPIS
jgi:hypothetical protein